MNEPFKICDGINEVFWPFDMVPLERAMIAWTPKRWWKTGMLGEPGNIFVIPWPQPTDQNWFQVLGLTDSTGACLTKFQNWTTEARLNFLHYEAWRIVCRDGLDPRAVHNALFCIPEYREAMNNESWFA